jgi:hypothetical protein
LIGDVNESNFLVSNSALVTLVDCDSIQVLDKQRNVRFRCPVGKAEFTPPELQDRDFSGIDRDTTHDYFSLGVITFLLLMEGVHPFMGSWRGYGNAPQLHENIKDGRFPYGNASVLVPSPIAPPLEILPGDIRTLFERCFVAGHDSPKARPTAQEWQRALKRLDNALQVCRTNGHHVFSGHLTQCPWCQRAAKLRGFDPFPLHEPQIPKPPAAVRQPRAAATATVQPQVAVKRTAEALRAAAPYVLFASVCVMAIGAWLYFNSPLGPAAVDLFSRWRYGEPPAISDLVGRSEPAQPAEPAESVDVEPEPLESTVAIRKSPRSPRSRTSAPRVAEPGVLVLPPRQNAGPNVVALEHLGSRTVEPSTRNEIVNSKASEPAASPASTVRGERTYNAKHKHRLGGCDGVLTLTADGIRYESKDHSFSFGIEETELDDDGITDPSGKNWHFSIKDTDVRTLIRQWRDGNLF